MQVHCHLNVSRPHTHNCSKNQQENTANEHYRRPALSGPKETRAQWLTVVPTRIQKHVLASWPVSALLTRPLPLNLSSPRTSPSPASHSHRTRPFWSRTLSSPGPVHSAGHVLCITFPALDSSRCFWLFSPHIYDLKPLPSPKPARSHFIQNSSPTPCHSRFRKCELQQTGTELRPGNFLGEAMHRSAGIPR